MVYDVLGANLAYAAFDPGRNEEEYSLLVASVGFEGRATHVATQSGLRFSDIWAIEYDANRELNYRRNREIFEGVGTVLPDPGEELRDILVGRIDRLIDLHFKAKQLLGIEDQAFRIAVDISCMNRDRMALVALAVLSCAVDGVEVDFLYSPAAFAEDLVGSEGAVVVNRPILGLDGWTVDPNLPVTCLIGAGFESRLAMAAIETLEPASTVWLFPRGLDGRYDEVVEKRNYGDAVSVFDHVSQYDIRAPYRLISDLDATVSRLLQGSRVVLVPLGPKIFALCAILIGITHPVGTTIWRLSADTERTPEDRIATGPIVGLRVRVLT
jgi:hypothetical protein